MTPRADLIFTHSVIDIHIKLSKSNVNKNKYLKVSDSDNLNHQKIHLMNQTKSCCFKKKTTFFTLQNFSIRMHHAFNIFVFLFSSHLKLYQLHLTYQLTTFKQQAGADCSLQIQSASLKTSVG